MLALSVAAKSPISSSSYSTIQKDISFPESSVGARKSDDEALGREFESSSVSSDCEHDSDEEPESERFRVVLSEQ